MTTPGRDSAVVTEPGGSRPRGFGRRYGLLVASTVLTVVAVVAFAPRWWRQLFEGVGTVVGRHRLAVVLLAAGLACAAVQALRWWRGRGSTVRRLPVVDRLPLFAHVTLLLLLASVIAAATGLLLWRALGSPPLAAVPGPTATPGPLTAPGATAGRESWTAQNTLDAFKVVLAVVAGIGGVVALTVAYRKQAHGEAAEHRENTKLFNERFGRAADQLGAERTPVRLAGAYAMAKLADDWEQGRQTCIDVLCAYLRVSPDADIDEGERQVRQTLFRLIRDNLRSAGAEQTPRWQGGHFDLTGADLGDADLSELWVSAGTTLLLTRCAVAGTVAFHDLRVSDGGAVLCTGARLTGGTLAFDRTVLTGGRVCLDGMTVDAGRLNVVDAEIGGGELSFSDAEVNGGDVVFDRATVSGGRISFADATVAGGHLSFDETRLTGGTVTFARTGLLEGSTLTFVRATFSGTQVTFSDARFYGGVLNLAEPRGWSTPPTGVGAGVRGVAWPSPTHLARLR